MTAKKVNHSKVKSSGLLFELLVRQITADTLSNRQKSPALSILQKYFNAGTELGRELQLYRAFSGIRRLSETKALNFIDMVIAQRKKLDERKLAREKYNLIREIKEAYPLKEFLGSRIPNYTLNASIYKLFASELAGGEVANVRDVAEAKFTLLEHLTAKPSKRTAAVKTEQTVLLEEFKKQPEDMRLIAYKRLIERFNEKYQNLDKRQKELLREYINSTDNSSTLYAYVKQQLPIMKKELLQKTKRVHDKVQQIKLNEVATQLDTIGSQRKVIRDNEISAILNVYEILRELEE